MSRSTVRDWIIVGGTVSLIAIGVGGSAIVQKRHDAKINAIMLGEVRGNKQTGIFHVPTCSEYNSIKPENLRVFDTVADAKDANYRPSRNCLSAVETRNINETETNDGPDGGHDDPRY